MITSRRTITLQCNDSGAEPIGPLERYNEGNSTLKKNQLPQLHLNAVDMELFTVAVKDIIKQPLTFTKGCGGGGAVVRLRMVIVMVDMMMRTMMMIVMEIAFMLMMIFTVAVLLILKLEREREQLF